ncbi:hypothetical protein L2E82_49747 [Cichorium intybus]|uniref:Uncharacterized protein n=1 Tax=Cichorium intybus TaxID=13427 RepID=A0ACB8Z1D0_CICIN|nr:hypothetical protein L2E82_49747 [Cichorium intybus]
MDTDQNTTIAKDIKCKLKKSDIKPRSFLCTYIIHACLWSSPSNRLVKEKQPQLNISTEHSLQPGVIKS